MKRRLLAVSALSLLAAAKPAAPQIPVLPPYAGVYEPQGVDERGLWMEADEDERRIRDSNLLIRDAALNDYVRSVLCRTVGEDRCRNVRIYIMRVPAFNASMAPNGTLTIWTGLLLRCRSEAELASVLGHEFGHFEKRHSLLEFRHRRSTTDVLAWTAALSALAGVPNSSGLLLIGGHYRFNRDQEREADLLGFSYLSRSTYRPQVASEIWVRQMDETDASAIGRAQRSRRYDRTAYFATHPTDGERAGYLSRLAGPELAGRTDNVDAYEVAMRPWMRTLLDDQIKLNDFGATEFLLAQLAASHWTADLLYARGELYRMRGNPRDLVNAADFYRQSINLDGSRAEAYRGLGMSLMRARMADEGKIALEHYLSMQPDAADAPMVRMLISQSL